MNKELTDHENRLKRLRYRSWHRGCKETDLILGWFADEHLCQSSPEQLGIYEKFLGENDTDIWDWLTEKTPLPSLEYSFIIEILKPYGQNYKS